jgi:hypothetical protein
MKPLDLLASLVLESGSRWGEVAVKTQISDARAILDAERPYHYVTRARGYSKTSDLSGIALAWLLTHGHRQSEPEPWEIEVSRDGLAELERGETDPFGYPVERDEVREAENEYIEARAAFEGIDYQTAFERSIAEGKIGQVRRWLLIRDQSRTRCGSSCIAGVRADIPRAGAQRMRRVGKWTEMCAGAVSPGRCQLRWYTAVRADGLVDVPGPRARVVYPEAETSIAERVDRA